MRIHRKLTSEDFGPSDKEIRQQKQFAELGRLMVESPHGMCHSVHHDEKYSTCRHCDSFEACKKRAELLAERNGEK